MSKNKTTPKFTLICVKAGDDDSYLDVRSNPSVLVAVTDDRKEMIEAWAEMIRINERTARTTRRAAPIQEWEFILLERGEVAYSPKGRDVSFNFLTPSPSEPAPGDGTASGVAIFAFAVSRAFEMYDERQKAWKEQQATERRNRLLVKAEKKAEATRLLKEAKLEREKAEKNDLIRLLKKYPDVRLPATEKVSTS